MSGRYIYVTNIFLAYTLRKLFIPEPSDYIIMIVSNG